MQNKGLLFLALLFIGALGKHEGRLFGVNEHGVVVQEKRASALPFTSGHRVPDHIVVNMDIDAFGIASHPHSADAMHPVIGQTSAAGCFAVRQIGSGDITGIDACIEQMVADNPVRPRPGMTQSNASGILDRRAGQHIGRAGFKVSLMVKPEVNSRTVHHSVQRTVMNHTVVDGVAAPFHFQSEILRPAELTFFHGAVHHKKLRVR